MQTSTLATQDLTKERIAVNQSRFREANERIEAAADTMELLGPIPFICECPVETCLEIVRVTFDDYEDVRRDPRLFVCAPGHEAPSIEAGAGIKVAETAGYVVIEKVGVAGEIAAEKYRSAHEGPLNP
jgi:hypothetical protein